MTKAGETAVLIINRVRSLADELFDSLPCATVIWYTRPFIASDERDRFPWEILKLQDKSHWDLHDRLILQRNRFTAHMDKKVNEMLLTSKEAPIMVGDSRIEVLSHSPFVDTGYFTPVLSSDCRALQLPTGSALGRRRRIEGWVVPVRRSRFRLAL